MEPAEGERTGAPRRPLSPLPAEDVAAAGQLAIVAGAAPPAELVLELPVWDTAEGIRTTQAEEYWKRVTASLKYEGYERNVSAEERVARNREQLSRAFPSLSQAGWSVKYSNKAYSCSHPAIMGGTKFTGLTAIVRATANYLYQQDAARAEAEAGMGDAAQDLLGMVPALAPDVSGSLAEVSQLIANDGPLRIFAKSLRTEEDAEADEAVTPLEVSIEVCSLTLQRAPFSACALCAQSPPLLQDPGLRDGIGRVQHRHRRRHQHRQVCGGEQHPHVHRG